MLPCVQDLSFSCQAGVPFNGQHLMAMKFRMTPRLHMSRQGGGGGSYSSCRSISGAQYGRMSQNLSILCPQCICCSARVNGCGVCSGIRQTVSGVRSLCSMPSQGNNTQQCDLPEHPQGLLLQRATSLQDVAPQPSPTCTLIMRSTFSMVSIT